MKGQKQAYIRFVSAEASNILVATNVRIHVCHGTYFLGQNLVHTLLKHFAFDFDKTETLSLCFYFRLHRPVNM